MTEIRIARAEEKPKLKQLWKECFSEPEPFLSFWFDNVCRTDMAAVAADKNELLGALHMQEYTLFSFGRKYKAVYICGFGVEKEKRKKGIGRKILEYAHDLCRKSGADFVFLMPAIDGYYEKFGYVPCSENVVYEFAPSDIKCGHAREVRRAESADGLGEIYRKYAEKYDVYLNRSMKDCFGEYSLYDGGVFTVKDKGYMLCKNEKDYTEVFETAYTDTDTLCAFLAYLKANAKERIVFHAPPSDEIKRILYGAKVKKTVERGIMAKPLRKLDTENVFGFCGGRVFINIF